MTEGDVGGENVEPGRSLRDYWQALRLVSRTSERRTFNIASWHWPDSPTWLWVLSVNFGKHVQGLRWPLTCTRGHVLDVRLYIPWLCTFIYQQQERPTKDLSQNCAVCGCYIPLEPCHWPLGRDWCGELVRDEKCPRGLWDNRPKPRLSVVPT